MDHAVAIVQAYLQVNGYFTITEYPVLTRLPDGGYTAATDIDLVALRLMGAKGGVAAGHEDVSSLPDPALAIPNTAADLLVVEVKEGRAEMNTGVRDGDVLWSVLERFGLERHDGLKRSLDELTRRGETRWPGDVSVRLVGFGSTIESSLKGFRAISLVEVSRFLSDYVSANWDALRQAHIKHEALGNLALLEQLRRVEAARPVPEDEPAGE